MPVLKYRPNVGSPWQVVGITGQTQVVGMFPQIIVTAPTGSTVTCSKGDVVLSVEEVDGTWTFILNEYGTYTVAISNGTITHLKKVVVNAVAQYNIDMDYKLRLYENGNEYEEVTGGWVRGDNVSDNYITKYDDRLLIYYGRAGNPVVAKTVNNISTSMYSSLHVIFSLESYIDESNFAKVGFVDGDSWNLVENTTDTSMREVTIDISSIDISAPVYINGYDVRINLYKIWLE